MIRSWNLGGVIGVGGFGRVYLCLNNETGTVFAMKEVEEQAGNPSGGKHAAELQNEIAVLSELDHPNIVGYLGARREGTKLNIFMEYAVGLSGGRGCVCVGGGSHTCDCHHTRTVSCSVLNTQ